MKIDIEHVRCLGSTGGNLTSGLDDVGEADDVTSKRTPHAGLQHGQIQSSAAAAVEGNSHHAAATEARTDSSRGIADKNETPANTLGGESEEHRARGSEPSEGKGEGSRGQRTSVIDLPDRGRAKLGAGVTTSVMSASRPPASAADTMEMDGQRDSDPSPAGESSDSSSEEAESAADDEIDLPQPLAVVEPREDFDWRTLKPRVYGKSLPPLDPTDRQSIEAAIVRRGIDHEILIDELSNIIDGSTRWEICLDKGIVPPVKMVSGLTNEEKEELAISSNADRRQLRDPDVERQVREARLENMFKGREENKKKFTLTRIARATGLSVATVSLRWRARRNSRGENASIGDARQLYGDDLKSEAVRLVEMGMPVADVSRLLPISRKAVERAVKKAKEREAGGPPAKAGKGKKAAAAQSAEEIEDIAGVDGDSELYRRAVAWLDLDAEECARLDEDCREQAREVIENASTDDVESLLRHAVYGKYLRDFAHELLEERCRSGAEEGVVEEAPSASYPDAVGHEADEELDGAVHIDEPDVAPVSLPTGDRGVIAEGDTSIARLAVAEDGGEARIRVNGFESEPGLADRDPMTQDDRTRAAEPNLDDRSSPYEKHFGRKGEPKK